VGIAVLCLLVAILAAVAMGTGPVLVCLLTAAGILFYNLTGKHLPATGIVMLGLIRMVGMFIPNPQLGFAWPVVLAMTHTTFAAAVVYRLEDKRPRLRPSERGGIFAGWAFWTLVLLGWMSVFDGMNLPNEPLVWVGPAVAAAIFAAGSWAFLYRAQRRPGGRTALAGYYARGSTAWLVAYDATWLLSSGQWWPGILHLALLATACASVLAYRPGQDEGRDELPYVVST